MKNYFLLSPYTGADGEAFQSGVLAYLKNVQNTMRWDSMSDHALFLQGGRQMLNEIIAELEK
jgi:hypothetical protein